MREKGDIIQEKDKTIRDLKYALDELKSQNAFLLEEFQKTKSEFLEYVGNFNVLYSCLLQIFDAFR